MPSLNSSASPIAISNQMTVATAERKTDVLFVRNVKPGTRQFIEEYQALNRCSSLSDAVRSIIHEAHVQHLIEQHT